MQKKTVCIILPTPYILLSGERPIMAQQQKTSICSLVVAAVLTAAWILLTATFEIAAATVDVTLVSPATATTQENGLSTMTGASTRIEAIQAAVQLGKCEGTKKNESTRIAINSEKDRGTGSPSTEPNSTILSPDTEESDRAEQQVAEVKVKQFILEEDDEDDDEEDEQGELDDEFWDEEEDYEEDEEEAAGPGAKCGVLQSIKEDDEATWDKLYETEAYMEQFALTTDRYVNKRGVCRNRHELCTYWAANGECDANPVYMLAECGPACEKCTRPADGPGVEFGMVQDLESEPDRKHAAVAKLAETKRYMREVIWSNDLYVSVRNLCFNHDEKCTLWAVRGECDKNSGYMSAQCGPACGTCKDLHYDSRCAADPADPNAWQPGDLNRMFERIVATDFSNGNTTKPRRARVLSRPEYLPGDDEHTAGYKLGPWIIMIDNFMTSQEAEILIHHGKKSGYERSTAVGEIDETTGEQEKIEIEFRTSSNAWCETDCENDPIVKSLIDRIEQTTGIPSENSEPFQLLKCKCNVCIQHGQQEYQDSLGLLSRRVCFYCSTLLYCFGTNSYLLPFPDGCLLNFGTDDEGQFYDIHDDYIEQQRDAILGPRILTFYMYLNDVEEGGETRFDYFENGGMKVKPKRGRIILWPNVLNDNPLDIDDRTEHEALPVIKGRKYGANAWIHLRSSKKAARMNC